MKQFGILISLAVLLLFNTVATATNVSGVISANTTWTKANSPYIITGNTAVDSGVTLTIEPGVDVKFDGAYYLYVDGRLLAIGTNTDSIHFTSNKTTPATGDWKSVYIRSKNNNDTTIFKYCAIDYATDGITILNYSTHVYYCNIRKNARGIYFYLNNQSAAIINNNNISNNVLEGVELRSCTAREISNNIISYNMDCGIKADYTLNVRVLNNTIFNCNDGIYLKSMRQVLVMGNVVYTCKLNGIVLGYTGSTDTIAYGNQVWNCGTGILITEAKGLLAHNGLVYNGTGIENGYTSSLSNAIIVNNCIEKSAVYAYKHDLSSNIDLKNNYWGKTDSLGIDSIVMDYYDNLTSGKVNFMPFLLTKDSGCQAVNLPTGCAPPAHLRFTAITSSAATIQWDSVTGAMYYEYSFSTSSTPPSGGVAISATNTYLSGLQAGKRYYVCVRTICVDQPSSWTCIDSVTIPAAIEDVKLNNNISVYPNPFSDQIQFNSKAENIKTIRIQNVLGAEVAEINASAKEAVVDTRQFAKGVYIYKILLADNTIVTGKLLKE